MKHLFVPHSISVLAKEKGFDEPCFSFYNEQGIIRKVLDTDHAGSQDQVNRIFSGVLAPLYQQLVDWMILKGYYIYVFPITKTSFAYSIDFMRTVPDKFSKEDFYGNTNTKQIVDQILEEEKLKGWENLDIEEQATFKYTRSEAYNKAFENVFKLI